jgi:thiol-disulfide isomerase/thioredoxin
LTQSFQIGPLALPFTLLVTMTAVALGMFIGKRAGRKLGIDVEPLFFKVLPVAAVCARLAFVWQYHAAYFNAPLDILDIRDGGWDPQFGLVAAWTYVLLLTRPRPLLRKPMVMGMAAASAFWMVGSITLAVQAHDEVQLPGMALSSLDQGTVSLQDFKGKPTVVNLWATWCPPCQREMPVLQQAQAAHPELHFTFLNQGESAAKVQEFLSARSLPLHNVLLDPKGKAGTLFSLRALPATLFFNAQGLLVYTHIGGLSRATLAQRLDALTLHPTSTK